MNARIKSARYLGGYTVWVQFSDGVEGTVNFAGELSGPMFEPLRDVQIFSRVTLHQELRTLVWPNGADVAPEFVRARLRSVA